MSTIIQTGVVAGFRCPDPRNTFELALGTTSLLEWGLVEFPSMAGSIPAGAAEETERLGVNRILMMVHGEFVQFEGCGARHALASIKYGKPPSVVAAAALPSWLDRNIHSADIYEQAIRLSCDAGMAFSEAEVLTVLFDQKSQTMFPLAVKPMAGGDWLYVERTEWDAFVANSEDSAVPMIDMQALSPWMRRIVDMNHTLASESADIAEQSGYDAFSVKCVVANATSYAPGAYKAVRKLLGINPEDPKSFAAPYYSVYCHPNHPEWWWPQLAYAYDHLTTQGVKVIFLGHDEKSVDMLAQVHNEDPYYTRILRAYGGVEYGLVVNPPGK